MKKKNTDYVIIGLLALIAFVLITNFRSCNPVPVISNDTQEPEDESPVNEEEEEEEEPIVDTCTDFDSGKNIYESSHCEDSITMLGYADLCVLSNTVREQYCENGRCVSQEINCPVGWTCIQGQCEQFPCTSIFNPPSQSNCDAGYCGTGSCNFVAATLVSPAKCICS